MGAVIPTTHYTPHTTRYTLHTTHCTGCRVQGLSTMRWTSMGAVTPWSRSALHTCHEVAGFSIPCIGAEYLE